MSRRPPLASPIVGYPVAAALAAVVTAVAWFAFGHRYLADVVMLYLLAVVVASLTLGRGPSLATGVLSVLAFDVFFIPPFFTLTVHDLRHVVTFVVMLLVAVVISHLTQRVREQAEARAQLAEENARTRLDSERERLRSALLSSVSHDLRTPLGVIEGSASTLLDEAANLDEATRRDLLATIREEAERLGRRVRNLLDMTRLEAGAVELDVEWQSLEEVVGAALERVERGQGERRVSVHLPDSLPLVPYDGALLEQVLVNLLENALKYSPARSPVEVSACEDGTDVVVTVADRGPGVPVGEERRIFEKFQRGSATRGAGGVGLGLAICRAIVTAHGGRIWVEGREGGGAAFRLALPRKDPPPGAPPEDLPSDTRA